MTKQKRKTRNKWKKKRIEAHRLLAFCLHGYFLPTRESIGS